VYKRQEPEKIVGEDPDEDKQSMEISPTQSPAEVLKDEETEETQVKTKVNEILPVEEAPEPDVEQVNLQEDVLLESTDIPPEAIFAEELPVKPQESERDSIATPSEDSAEQPTLGTNQDVPPADEQKEELPQTDTTNPTVEEGDLIALEDVDIAPEISKRVDPKYPSVAFQRGVEGKVLINVLISETGDVIETSLIKGIPGPYGFNEDCADAVRQWKFVPAFKNGVKVKVWKAISFTFKKT
jgi:protein TonB